MTARHYAQVNWSDAERTQLRQLWENGISLRKIAAMMGRSINSISRQVGTLGLSRRVVPPELTRPANPQPPARAGKSTLPPLPSLRMLSD